MEISESNTNGDTEGIWVSSESFTRYAEVDLDRWRQLVGHQVQHADSRWGTGIVEAVSWGSPCDHVPAYVQVRIRYPGGLDRCLSFGNVAPASSAGVSSLAC